MEWFKFYGGAYLSDPKMLMLTACERSCWITLLSYASVSEDGGRIKYLTEEQLMIASSVSPMNEEWDRTLGVLNKFEKLGMIELSNGEVTVKNWQKRQETYLTNAERQRRFREKQKSNAEVTEQRNESNARIRIEENRIDNTNTVVVVSEDSEEQPKPKKTHGNLDGFGLFKESYPRNEDMVSASAEWRKLTADEKSIVLLDIPKRKESEMWTKDEGKYVPLAKTYLKNRRWEDEIKSNKIQVYVA